MDPFLTKRSTYFIVQVMVIICTVGLTLYFTFPEFDRFFGHRAVVYSRTDKYVALTPPKTDGSEDTRVGSLDTVTPPQDPEVIKRESNELKRRLDSLHYDMEKQESVLVKSRLEKNVLVRYLLDDTEPVLDRLLTLFFLLIPIFGPCVNIVVWYKNKKSQQETQKRMKDTQDKLDMLLGLEKKEEVV